jgi:hypothetical protein
MGWVEAAIIIASIAYALYLQSKIHGIQTGQTIQGPTAGEGIAIPVVFGTRQITNPNVCWYGNQEDINSDGTHYYNLTVQTILCHGKLDKLIDIVTNGKRTMSCYGSGDASKYTDPVTVDGTVVQAGQIGVHPDSSKFLMSASVKMGAVNNAGTDAGIADAMANALSLIVGPKYFGVAQLYGQVALGTSPVFYPFECIVQRIHTRLGGTVQWYDEKAEIRTGRSLSDDWKYKLQAADDNSDLSAIAFDDSDWPQAPGPFSNAQAAAVLMDYNNYPLPLVKTQLPVDGTLIIDGGTFYYGNKFSGGKVQAGCKLWLRWDLGPLPAINIFAQLWHDDSAKLFFNGTEIALKPTVIDAIPNNQHFNSTAAIPASLIDTDGPNVVAMRVQDTFASIFGEFGLGPKIGGNQLIFAGLQLGNDTSVPGKLVDMNPAHIIREAYTDTLWGMGYSADDLDDASFTAVADTLYAENFGLSLTWVQQSTIEEFVTEVLRHVSGARYVDRVTGLIKLKLIRNDYAIDDLLVLDESKLVKLEDVKRKLVGELANSVTVTYSATPRGDQGSLTIFDEGLLQMQGGVVSSKIDYPGVTNSFIAGNLALRDLRMLSTPLLSCTAYASRHAADLNIGDAFVLNEASYGIDHMVMRVLTIDVGDGVNNTVKLTCVEDVFFYPNQRVSATNAPIAQPVPVKASAQGTVDYHTCRIDSARNGGQCECAFNGSAWSEGGLFPGWTEIAPGIMERTEAGPLAAGMLDGVDPDDDNATGVSSLIGKRVLALPRVGEDGTGAKKYAGVYIVRDVGRHFVDYGLPTWEIVDTHARLERDAAFSLSSQFVANLTLQMRNGDTYGDHFLRLSTVGVVLGTTEQDWTDEGTSLSFANTYALLKTEQLASQAIPLDVLDVSATRAVAGSHDFDIGFETLVGTPGATAIPAGPWRFTTEAAWLDPDYPGDPGSVTTLGYKAWRLRASGGSSVLFEVLSEPITEQSVGAAVADIVSQQPDILLNGDRLVLIPTIHTTSTTPVKLWLRYNSPSLRTGVQIPVAQEGVVIVETPTPIVVPASAMQLDGPSRYTILGSAGNHTTAIGLPHGSTMGASVLVQIPKTSQSGTMQVRPVWAPSADASSGAVRWNIVVTTVGAGLITDAGTATPFTGQAAPFVADTPSTEDGCTVAAVVAGTWLRIGIQRLGTDGADTYTGQANLLGLQIDY